MNLIGNWTLTITASAACSSQLAPVYRERTFQATITQYPGPGGPTITFTLENGRLCTSCGGVLRGDTIDFGQLAFSDEFPAGVAIYSVSLLPASGRVSGPVIEGTGSGSIQTFSLQALQVNECRAADHRLRFVRR